MVPKCFGRGSTDFDRDLQKDLLLGVLLISLTSPNDLKVLLSSCLNLSPAEIEQLVRVGLAQGTRHEGRSGNTASSHNCLN